MITFKNVLLVLSASMLCRPATAAVTTVLKSSIDGPTVLVAVDPGDGDLSCDVAVAQAGSWKLTRGSLQTTPLTELTNAVQITKPTEIVILQTARSTTQPSIVQARGTDVQPIADLLNTLTDEHSEKVSTDTNAIESVEQIPPGIKVVSINLVLKKEGPVPAARSRLFRNAIHLALTQNKMTDSDSWTVMNKIPGTISVAMYAGTGSSSSPGIKAYPKALSMDSDIQYTYFGTQELLHHEFLNQFDVIVFCGGGGGSQAAAIGHEGAKIVQNFVHNGGGYVSSCAGSYLASSGKSYSLHLINADVLDSAHWARGMGDVDMELTDAGRQILGDYKGLFKIHYANGPLLGPGSDKTLPDYTTLGYFRSDMHKNAPGGVMPNTPAIIAADYGKGRVICFSPHPEYTAGLEGFIGRAVHWTVHQPMPVPAAQ